MKFGIILPTFCYNQQRVKWAIDTFDSIAKTKYPSEKPNLLIIEKQGSGLKLQNSTTFQKVFSTELIEQPNEIQGTEQTLAWGTACLAYCKGITHIVWMGDDALFHPDWLIELEDLITRHPQAKAWSVYRSAYVKYHTPLVIVQDEYKDIQVRSICGHGMTFTTTEWKEWGIDWRGVQRWPSVLDGLPANTLDIHHAANRPGDRWVTNTSYIQHTGKHGINVKPWTPEYGLNFAGTAC